MALWLWRPLAMAGHNHQDEGSYQLRHMSDYSISANTWQRLIALTTIT